MQVEVALHPHSGAQPEQVREPVLALLRSFSGPLVEGMAVPLDGNEVLRSHVRHVRVFETGSPTALTSEPSLHVHHLFEDEAAEEDVGEGNEEVTAFQLYTLPGLEFDGLWESLVYDDEVQPRLLRYVSSAMRFSAAGVDGRVIAWNRVVLLHGPPGTGKTSLCRGLAHKLAVRLSSTYAHGHLVEVNAHSLFSKWFSESGKMVMALFARIRELLDDGDAFVCVLVDEVESLAASRTSASAGTEPSDSIRVVNALLTQLDGLRRYPHCLVLTTSNLTGAIDAAFIDRADIKQYIGPPGVVARYEILRGCVNELERTRLVAPPADYGGALLPPQMLRAMMPTPAPSFEALHAMPPPSAAADGAATASSGPRHAMMLHAIAEACDGLSGRALRKLPFLAYALFGGAQSDAPLTVEQFLLALRQGVDHERDARGSMA